MSGIPHRKIGQCTRPNCKGELWDVMAEDKSCIEMEMCLDCGCTWFYDPPEPLPDNAEVPQ